MGTKNRTSILVDYYPWLDTGDPFELEVRCGALLQSVSLTRKEMKQLRRDLRDALERAPKK
jgi:hypothetical protein